MASPIEIQLEGEVRPVSTPRWLAPLGIVGFLCVLAAQAYGFIASPPDRDMGNLEKIMYVHVPAAQMAFMCYTVVFFASALYLWKRAERFDLIAAASAEVGAVLNGLTLMLGSIWGRPTWGVWWTWDARLTSTAVLMVIFVGYLVLRAFTEDAERRAKWSAAIGIFGALNMPIVFMSVRWWRTLHQVQSSPTTLAPQYQIALWANAISVMLVVIYFVAWRYDTARIERATEQLADANALAVTEVETLEVVNV